MSSAQDDNNPSTSQTEGASATTSAQATDQQIQPSQQANKSEGNENPTAGQPLAPPPKPSQQQNSQNTPDYFSGQHNNAHFSLEPNPFEQSFGNPSTETPSKNFGGLPSVASLTSPAPLGPGGTPNWQNSLRSGPLSPAMLQGPASNANGYFDEAYRNSYPTPNESSLRTGLTPGGGGSMFPAPSPNSQAIFNLQSGGATPGTLDFQRTAMNAAARSKPGANNDTSKVNSNPSMSQSEAKYQPAQQAQPAGRPDNYAAHPESEAVNSLYMLAQTGSRQAASNNTTNNQFAVPSQNSQNSSQAQRMQSQQQDHLRNKQSVSSLNSIGDGNEYDEDESPEQKTSARSGKGKKGSGSKGAQNGNARRKADETPSKQPASKKRRGNNGGMPEMDPDDDSDDMGSIKDEDGDHVHANGRKMTDEEKRKNFLERNRVAALKCRQRKKQWLANLQTKVEIFTSENDALTAQCTQLREEVINLKTLLLAHKDCPVSHQQGLGGQAMAQFMGEFNPHGNPYGLQMGGAQGMQRS